VPEHVHFSQGRMGWYAEVKLRSGVVQGSGQSQDVKETSDEEVNDDKRGAGSEKKRKEARCLSFRLLGLRACSAYGLPGGLCEPL